MSLRYEPSSEPLHISAKHLFLNMLLGQAIDGVHGGKRTVGAVVDEQDILLSDEDEEPRAKVPSSLRTKFKLKIENSTTLALKLFIYYTKLKLKLLI